MRNGVIQDDTLPQLQKATDPKIMAAAFEAFFSDQYPGRGLKVNDCQISRVQHRPGKECNITYRLSGHDCDRRAYDQWIFAKMLASGGDHNLAPKEQPSQWPGCDFWKPLSSWREMNMLLHAFPYDVKMPYLGQLLEPEFVRKEIETRLPSFGLTNAWTCREVTCHKIKYMPTRRCVLRYDIVFADAANRQRQIEFYSKTYNSANSRYVYDVLSAVCASPACRSGKLNIPAPIANLDNSNTLWQHAWAGTKFGSVMRERGWASLPHSGFMPKIATMLAALHQVEIPDVSLLDGPTTAQAIENAYADAEDIAQFLPEHRTILAEAAKTLADMAPKVAVHSTRATIHGSFKVAQLLCREQELALVDFDSISRGDPLYDLAEFFASILYLIVSDSIPAAAMIASVESFWSAYQQQVAWACDRRSLAWYLVAFLLGKMHSSLKRFESQAIENMPLAFDLVKEWLAVVKRKA
ncbi:MAG: phosphotransferase family protein [bacterium]